MPNLERSILNLPNPTEYIYPEILISVLNILKELKEILNIFASAGMP